MLSAKSTFCVRDAVMYVSIWTESPSGFTPMLLCQSRRFFDHHRLLLYSLRIDVRMFCQSNMYCTENHLNHVFSTFNTTDGSSTVESMTNSYECMKKSVFKMNFNGKNVYWLLWYDHFSVYNNTVHEATGKECV